MYKNIEILDKTKHAELKFEEVADIEVAKNIGIVPLGVDEILDVCSIAPVLISAGENGEFIAFTGIANNINIYKNETLYIPRFVKSYPFFNIEVKDEKGDLNTIVAIDNNKEYIGKKKKNFIFNKEKELAELASEKIGKIRELHTKRDIGKSIVKELQAKNLLLKKDFRVNDNGEEKVILQEFYIINRDALLKLDDTTLAVWARKGWMGIIDAHIKSLGNFQKVLAL